MALYSHKLSKPKYHNWVKATLAVLLTKEGIEPCVYKEIQEFQLKCLDDICYDNGIISGETCSRCCTENVVACPTRSICNVQHGRCSFHGNAAASVRCPNNICPNFKDKIQRSHHHKGPSYKNTDASQWCSNPWEVAKCFMPPDGYKDVKSPAETDFNGINSIIINYKGFQAKIKDRNIFEKARVIGRDVRHSPNLEIDTSDLQQYFTDLNTLLSDPGYLANDLKAQEAQQKLLQLQNDKLPLGEVYIRKVLDELDEVIKENMKKELDESKRQQKEENLKLLEESKKSIETLFHDKEKHVYSQIEKQLSVATDAIKKRKSEALEELNTEASNTLAMVQKEIQTSGNKQVAIVQKEIQTSGNKQVAMVQKEIQTRGDKQVDMVQKEIQTRGDKQVAMVQKEIQTRCDKEIDMVQKEIQTRGDKQVAMVQKEIQTSGDKQVAVVQKEIQTRGDKQVDMVQKEIQTRGDKQVDMVQKEIQTSGDKQVAMVQKEIQTRGDKQVAMVQKEIQTSCNKQVDMVQKEIQTRGDKQVHMVQKEMQTRGDKQVDMVQKEIQTRGDKQVDMVQKDIQTRSDKQVDMVQKEIQTRGDKQVDMVQKEIQTSCNEQVAMVQKEIQTRGDKQVDMVQKEIQTRGDKQVDMVQKEIRTIGEKQVDMVQKQIQTSGDKQVDMVQKEIQTSGDKQVAMVQKEIRTIGEKQVDMVQKQIQTSGDIQVAVVQKVIQTCGDEQVKRVAQASDENDEKIMNDHRKKGGRFQRMIWSVFPSRRLKDLQDDLISFYRDQHRTISLSPLLEKDTPLLEFYVMPDIYPVQNTLSGDKINKTAVTPLRNVFYNDDKMCRKIYLTADAGLGKTAFSKRLALAWCHTKKPLTNEGQYFVRKEIRMINEFRFVFLLLLRNCSSECEIDDIILNQIFSQLPRPYNREFLENVLFKERCLVILDGLDEWSHPPNSCKQGRSPIPHQKVRDRTAVLTTTRPWKLSVSGLQSSQIEQKLELVGLNQKSANDLKRSVISHLFHEKNERKLDNYVTEFTTALERKHIADLEAIPLLLMYLLFLWCNKIELGHSQCDLYSQITELLLSRTLQNYEFPQSGDAPQGDIPQCLSGKKHCVQFYTLLTSLGQLAYQTLFRETREENTLVFDGSVAEQYLTKDCLNFCLKTGLITQSKVSVPGTLLEHKSKVSFAHKTVQEFFAALYMHSTSDQTSVPEIVLSKCKSIEDILEMSKILKFSCGLNVNVQSLISREMMKIINEDEITLDYRSSFESSKSFFGFSHPLKDFQDMCISCCKEIPRENEVSLCLQDVFIERSCKQEQYRENLKQLTIRNKQNIRSFYIDMNYMSRYTPYSSVQKVIDYFALTDLENIEKVLCYKCGYYDLDSLPLLKKSVKCLHLSCREGGSWSRDLNTFECWGLESPVAIETMLETLRLSVNVKRVEMSFINLENRKVFSSEMVNIEYVGLWDVTMTASVFQGIVDIVQQQPRTVRVAMHGCDMNPESEFVKVKQKIKTSREHFRVVVDKMSWFGKVFKFQTIKQ